MSAKRLGALAAAMALALAACGDDDDETAGTGTGTGTGTQEEQPQPTPDKPASDTVTITETEFALQPAEVAVDKAGVVEFKVVNAGGIPHALEVENDELEEETEEIAPGENATLTVELARGTYKLYCPIGDHEDQGMTGVLRVAGASGSPEDDDGGDGGDDDNSGGAEAPEGDDSGGAEAPSGY